MKKQVFLMACIFALTCVLSGCETIATGPKAEQPDSIYVYAIASNGTETLSQVTCYTYDEVGNMILQLDSSVFNNENKSKTIMKYNSKRCRVEQRYADYSSSLNDWLYDICWRWTYDEKDKLATVAGYNDNGETIDEQPVTKGVYSWSDDNHAECLLYSYRGGNDSEEASWPLTMKQEFTYNLKGDVEKIVTYGVNGESTKLWMIEEQTFDQYGNVVFYTMEENGVMRRQDYYKYDYDDSGKILVKWTSHGTDDAKSGSLVSKSVYFY